MNSFAALIGSLTGATVSGAAGAGPSGASEGGLFAGLLQASMAAQPLAGIAAGAGLRASLTAGEGASTPGAIDLTTLLQASTDAPTGLVPPEGEAIAAVAADAVAAPVPAEAGPMEQDEEPGDAPAGADLLAQQQPADPPETATAAPTAPQTPDAGEQAKAVPAQDDPPAAPAAALPRQTGRDAAPGQERAAANRPEHAQLRASTAPGLTGATPNAPGKTPQAASATSAAPHAAGRTPATGEGKQSAHHQASKAAHLAANTDTPGEASGRPNALPADEAGSPVEPASKIEVTRIASVAPNGQAAVQLIRTSKTETGPAAGLDAAGSSIHVRAAAAPAQPALQQPQLPLNALAVHIAQQAGNGARRFDIRLDPPELGRVEVRLDVSKDGKVATHLVVERPETLDLLQRDARSLERALQNAGLDTSDGGLKFSLKDHGDQQAQPGQDDKGRPGMASRGAADDSGPSAAEIDNAIRTQRRYLATGGIDIRI